ncbi:MAG: hypothetical protein ACYTFT_08760, partial [Planctomycetota bacterium]
MRYVNEHVVPVWINVREDKLPEIPALSGDAWELTFAGEDETTNPYSYFYYARSVVVTPGLTTLLNDDLGRFG